VPVPDNPPRQRVVVVDHHDSYTWNLVHLVASVTGELPVVVEHHDRDVRIGEVFRKVGLAECLLKVRLDVVR
jgi:hypothetical protein